MIVTCTLLITAGGNSSNFQYYGLGKLCGRIHYAYYILCEVRFPDSVSCLQFVGLIYGWHNSVIFKFSQVTAVGINTEWGLLMATISEDNGEETPLQVCACNSDFFISLNILIFVCRHWMAFFWEKVRLNGVATLIGQVGLLVAFAVLFVLWTR